MERPNKTDAVLEDPFRFARDFSVLEGGLTGHALPRLLEAGAELVGEVVYRVEGRRVQREGRGEESFLELTVQGELVLQCQRCLGEMQWPFDLRRSLLLVASGGGFPEDELEDDSYDAIEAERDLDILALIEDEVLLALPIAPRHDACDAPDASVGTERKSPFAALDVLRGGKGRQ